MYKLSPANTSYIAGKRIVCANRYGRSGCGHTRQVYLADVIPHRRHRLPVVIAFIRRLLKSMLPEQAYLEATGCLQKETRHAWRWVSDLLTACLQWRTTIPKPVETFKASQPSQRLKMLLPTLAYLIDEPSLPDISAFQSHYQRAFF